MIVDFDRGLCSLRLQRDLFINPPVDVWLIWHAEPRVSRPVLLSKGSVLNLENTDSAGMKVVSGRLRTIVVSVTVVN